ncbi:MAG TPA: hypothetical protein VMT85_05815 [Thermoanaerobaculia bacterium]|nr:hypothetical protein [Thermoanaerobaculia bacterium]
MPPHVFAISPDAFRYARFERSDAVLELVEAREEPLPSDAFHAGALGGPARDPEQLGASFDRLLDAGADLEEASLVLPDHWLRLAFGELTELPKSRQARIEAFRFKLRQLVPFRVDELRVEGFEVMPLADQEEPRRVVIAFCIEALVRQLERLFAERGITLGLITAESLALSSLLEAGRGEQGGLAVQVLQKADAYTLLVSSPSGPVLFRHKASEAGLDPALRRTGIVRELRMTKSFLEDKLPALGIDGAWIAATEPAEWLTWLREGLGVEAEPLSVAALGDLTVRLPAGWSWSDGGPLLAVALEEVA